MNITVSKCRYSKQYVAHLPGDPWGFRREGRTKTEAYEACQAAIERQAKYLYSRTYVYTNEGTLFVLYYADGWWYDMVRPNERGIVHAPASTGLGEMSEEEAYERMLAHINNTCGGILRTAWYPANRQEPRRPATTT